MKDTHNLHRDAADEAHAVALAASLAKLRELLASLERGEATSFVLVHQIPGRAPRFCYRATGPCHDGCYVAEATMLACLEEVRAVLVTSCAEGRLRWREEEGAGERATLAASAPA